MRTLEMRRDEERKAREKQEAALQAQQEAAERAVRKKQETDEGTARLLQETLERQQQAAAAKAARQSQRAAEKERQETDAQAAREAQEAQENKEKAARKAYDDAERKREFEARAAVTVQKAREDRERREIAENTNPLKESTESGNQKAGAKATRDRDVAEKARREAEVTEMWNMDKEGAARKAQRVAEKEQREAPTSIVSQVQGSAKNLYRKAAEKPTRERPEKMKVRTAATAARHAQEATISTAQPTEKAVEDDPVYSMKSKLAIIQKQEEDLTAALEAEKVARKAARLARDKTRLPTRKTQNISQNKVYQQKEASPTDPQHSAKVRMAMMKKPTDDQQATQNARRHTPKAAENDPVYSVNARLAIIEKQEADRIAAMETEKVTKKVIRKSARPTKDRGGTLKSTSKPPQHTTNSITIPTVFETPSLHTRSPVPAPKKSSKPPQAPTRSSARSKKPVIYTDDPMDIDSMEDSPIPVVGLVQRPPIPARPSVSFPTTAPSQSFLLIPVTVEEAKTGNSTAKPGIGRRQPKGKSVSVEPASKAHKNTVPVAAGKRKRNSSLDLDNATHSTPVAALVELSKSLIVKLKVAAASRNMNGKRNKPHHDSPATYSAKTKRRKTTQAARRNTPVPNTDIEMQDNDAGGDEGADITSADEDSAWETSSATSTLSPPSPSHYGTPFTWPPLPALKPREREPFHNGLIIALENVAEDHDRNPNLTVLEVIEDLEENRPAHHREDWVTKATLKGGTFVYEGLKGLVEGLRGARTHLSTGELCLAIGAWTKREWERKGWVWPVEE